MLHADVLFSISAEAARPSRHGPPASLPNACFNHVYMCTAVQAGTPRPRTVRAVTGTGQVSNTGKLESPVPQRKIRREPREVWRLSGGGGIPLRAGERGLTSCWSEGAKSKMSPSAGRLLEESTALPVFWFLSQSDRGVRRRR